MLKAPALRLTTFGLVFRGGQALCSFLNAVLLAHALGPAGRGEYFLFVAAVALLARALDLGMSPSAVVFASRHPGALTTIHQRFVISVLGLWVLGAALALLATEPLGQLIGGVSPERTWLVVAVLPAAMYEQVWVHLMVGIRRVVAMNVLQLCAAVATIGLNVGLVLLRPGGVEAAVLIYCGVLVCKTPVAIGLAWRSIARLHSASERVPTVRELLAFSLRAYPNSLATLAWSRLPAFVLGAVQGAAAVGVFSIAQQMLEQLTLPVQATQDAIYQQVARLPRAKATSAMNRYLRTSLWGMLPVALVCGILAPWVIPLVFGEAFAQAAQVFQILLISLLASVVPALLSPYFFGQLQRPGLVSTIAWLRVLLALALSLVFIPPVAEIGSAIALATADVCATVLLLLIYARLTASPIPDILLPPRTTLTTMLRRLARA
ncbi:MAG: oligosaccharide flippase family protein [Chloroflexi bacterium]|nr:oligosaccharide flippase family protein [Chloroflexota bacterium]